MVFLPLSALAEHNDIHAEADRPGMGTGTNVLPFGFIQWEAGFECAHLADMHAVTLPTSLFRFGLGPWAEMRLEYTGFLMVNGRQENTPSSADTPLYNVEPLNIGTKIRLWGGSEESQRQWIPRTSLLLNIGVPLTAAMAKQVPFSGTVDLLFENDVADWLTIGYDVGAYWTDWTPAPELFASLAFNFIPTRHLGLFVESYNSFAFDAVDNVTSGTYTHCNINLDFGLTYMVHPHVQLDAYAGFNLYNSEPHLSAPRNNVYVGLGVTWLLHSGRKAKP